MKMYTNRSTNTTVISGTIKEIKPEGVVISTGRGSFNPSTKVTNWEQLDIPTDMPPKDGYKVGDSITAYGSLVRGNKLITEGYITDNKAFDIDTSLSLVVGDVVKAHMNMETKPDGTPNMKSDGVTPRKPHFDIQINTEDEQGRIIRHVVSIYSFQKKTDPEKGNGLSDIEKAMKYFKDFKSPTETPMRASIVTQPGDVYNWEYNEKTYFGCRHMGFRSIDVQKMYELQKALQTPTQDNAERSDLPNPAPETIPEELPFTSNAPEENFGSGSSYEEPLVEDYMP